MIANKKIWVLLLLLLLAAKHGLFAQGGPAGVGATDGSGNLSLWLDANQGVSLSGSEVTQWNDQSGYNNHATPPASGNRPTYDGTGTNSHPVITFDGSTDYLTASDAASLDLTTWSIILVAIVNTNKDYNAFIVKGSDANENYEVLTNFPSTGNFHYPVRYTSGDRSGDSEAGETISTSVYGIYQLDYDQSNFEFHIDGDQTETDAETRTPLTNSNDLYICNEEGVSGRNADASVAEIMIFSSPINTAQRYIIHNAMAAKYGFALDANDVYDEDDGGNGNHDFDVAGIGREDASNIHTDAQGTGWVRMNTASDLEDGEYLMWGHDNASLSLNIGDVPGGNYNRSNRVWRVSENGGDGVGTVTLTFDCSDFIIGDANDLVLLIDADGTFSSGATEHTTGLSYDNSTNVVTFTGVDFADNNYFTLASSSTDNVLGGIHYSIADGEYEDVSSVWALGDRNGTACGCSPATSSATSDAIITSHTLTLDGDEGVQHLKIENGGTLSFSSEVRFTINDGGSLRIEDGGSINGNGLSSGNNPRLRFLGSTDMNLYMGGTGNRIIDIDRMQFSSTAITTISGTGSIDVDSRVVLNDAQIVNSLTGTFAANQLRFNSTSSSYTNSVGATTSLTDDIQFNGDNSVLTNNGVMSLNDDLRIMGAGDINNTLVNTGTFTVGDDINASDESFTINNSGTFTHNGEFTNVGGAESFNNLNGGEWYSLAPDHSGVSFNCDDAANTFIYNRSGNQDVFIPADGEYYNLTIQGSNVKTPDGSITVLNNFTIGGTATAEMATNSADLTVGGNWTNSGGTFNESTRSVTFNNGNAQVLSGAETFYNLTINKSADHLTLSSAVQVDNSLSLTAGNIILGTNNLTINDNASISGPTASSFVVTDNTGVLRQNDIGSTGRNGDVVFPVGSSNSSYNPITVNNSSGTDDFFDVRVCAYVNEEGGCSGGTQISSGAVEETWQIDEGVAGGSSVTLTLQWNATDEQASFDNSNCFISHHNGVFWDPQMTATAASGSDPYTLTVSSLSDFSPFAVGTPSASALPIELLSFNAQLLSNRILLQWSTLTEINNDFFTIERSTDGIYFNEVAIISGAGNSTKKLDYTYTDPEIIGDLIYYRLKQTDFDGQFSYSSIQTVKIESASTTLQIFPNPTNGFVTLEGIGLNELFIRVYDVFGKEIPSLRQDFKPEESRLKIDLSGLHKGVYYLKTKTNTYKIYKL